MIPNEFSHHEQTLQLARSRSLHSFSFSFTILFGPSALPVMTDDGVCRKFSLLFVLNKRGYSQSQSNANGEDTLTRALLNYTPGSRGLELSKEGVCDLLAAPRFPLL